MASWVTPRTWVAGDVLTAAQLNEQVRDNTTILRASHTDSVLTACTAGTTTSTSFVDVPGTSVTMTFTKRHLDTSLIAQGYLSDIYNSGVNQNYLGISINGTDYTVATMNTGAAVRHQLAGNTAAIGSIAAGSVTVKLRVKVSAGTLTVDTVCQGSIVVHETS